MSRRPRLALVTSALLLSLSCKPSGPLAPGGDAPGKPGTAGTGTMQALAPVTRAAELLPPQTMVLTDIAGPARIAEIVGRDALVKQFPAEYGKLARDLGEALGVDVLDPKELAGIGVDPAGRIGVALVGVEPVTAVFYWTLSDAGRFRQFAFDAIRRAKQEVVTVPMSGAEVLRVKGERSALVLRAPVAMLVVQDGGEGRGDLALEIATRDPNVSLANDRAFRKTTGGLAPADMTTYFDAGALWERVREADAGRDEPEASNWARDELAKAKQDKAAPERIAELERQAVEVDESNARWKRRREAERTMVERLIGRAGRGVWSVSAKPGGLVAEAQLELGADAIPMKLLRNHPGSPALPKALSGRPMWMASGAMDVPELVAMMDLLMQTEGASWAELAAEAKGKLGVDLDAELRPLLTGTAGFAVTLDGKLDGDFEANAKRIGLAVDIELADAAKASALLDALGKRVVTELKKRKSKEFSLRRDAKHGGWAIDIPKWRTVLVSVAGHHLVISSDVELGKRLQSGAAGDANEHTQSAALAAASLPGAAFGGLLDIETLMLFGFSMRGNFADFSSVEDPETAKVPHSRAYKAKLRALEQARARTEAAQKKDAAAELIGWTAITRPWGSVAGNVTEQPGGVLARGGLFVRAKGGIAGALLESLIAVKALADRSQSEEVGRAFDEQMRLQNELQEIRGRDVEAWRAKHGKPGAVAVPKVPSPGG